MRNKSAFTLIELLVVVMIIGILVTLVTFGLRQAQESARDSKRRADLETIAAGLELYRAECNRYPASVSFGGSLSGGGTPATCSGTYITAIPLDPLPTARSYSYVPNVPGSSYVLCASLEQPPNPAMSTIGCGSCGTACNYRISRP